MSKNEFLKKLNDRYWGNDIEFMEELPEDCDSYPLGMAVIDGEVVVPKPKNVVTEWEFCETEDED
jgi:hypothetical protein